MASKPKRKRNYHEEYLIRKARGVAAGKSVSQARGHARAADLPSATASQPFKRSARLEAGLKLMKEGVRKRKRRCIATIWMGRRRQSGWSFWRSRRG